MRNRGTRLNRNATAETFGVDLKTVDAWKRGGCPFEEDGRNVYFHVAEVANFLRDRAVSKATEGMGSASIEESNRRRAAAEAGLAEIKLAAARREVVAVDAVASIVGDDYASLRSRLLSVPGHTEQRIAHLVEPDVLAKVTALVRGEICEALEELSAVDTIAEKALDDAA